MKIRFEWDEDKNEANQRKHGVSFEQAAHAFLDPLHLSSQDRIEDGEQRWQTFGMSAGLILLMGAFDHRRGWRRRTGGSHPYIFGPAGRPKGETSL